MDPNHKEKTAFTSYEGLYQFKYLSFGLCNAVATFERLMEFVLRGLHWKMCILYIDDIIVFADEFESHIGTVLRGASFGHCLLWLGQWKFLHQILSVPKI
jgi:hypothetical protein